MAIVAQNMQTTGAEFNPVIKGKRVLAIFGMCDIREYTFACQILQEDIMIFTNLISEIVHQNIHYERDEINQNLGDAFVAVWKVALASEWTKRSRSSSFNSTTSVHGERAHGSGPTRKKKRAKPPSMSSITTSPKRLGLRRSSVGSMREVEMASTRKQRRLSINTEHVLIEMKSQHVAFARGGTKLGMGYTKGAAS